MADVEAGYLSSEAAATSGLRRLSSMSEAPLPENTGSPPQEGAAGDAATGLAAQIASVTTVTSATRCWNR